MGWGFDIANRRDPSSPSCGESLLAKRYLDRLDTLADPAQFVCDPRVARQRRDVARDAALAHQEIPTVARDDPAVSLVSIEGPNDSVFQKKNTSLNPDERRSERRWYPDSISTLGLIVLLRTV
jgi:hypothetical protein